MTMTQPDSDRARAQEQEIYIDFGKQVTEARKKKGYSFEDLKFCLNRKPLNRAALHKIENGNRSVSLYQFFLICHVLGIEDTKTLGRLAFGTKSKEDMIEEKVARFRERITV